MVVVCASGCSDLLHPGHIRSLEHARSLGDILVVAMESDGAVRGRLGPGDNSNAWSRPITPAAQRAETLAALAAVDYVVDLEAESPHHPERSGCPIAHVPLEPGYSTARLIERILELNL
jgi:D-beta-D-heptose 7-phosphate kinase / D-beta-D-heptose 1-phosphate adenosyltransferase